MPDRSPALRSVADLAGTGGPPTAPVTVAVLVGIGHRDTARQIQLCQAHCGVTDYAIHHAPSSACSPPTARPGTSMHEHGLAIDFADCAPVTPCFQWLSAHAGAYGFYNLPSEPWHWSTSGS